MSHHEPQYKSGRINSLQSPLEEHWHLTQEQNKRLSLRNLSFKFVMSYPLKFLDSFKRTGRTKSLQIILEGSHETKDEELVESFRRLLFVEGFLPGNHDDYHTLLRFLRMRDFDTQKAKDAYLKMLKWREDYGVDVIAKEFTLEEYREVKRCYPHGFHGVDRYGRPLYIERIGMVDLNALLQVTTIDRFVKYHIVEQEKTSNLRYPACSVVAKKHIASTTSILDVKGVGMNNFSRPARELFTEIQKIDSNYYPETLHRLFIVNAGSGFRVLWKVLKAFLDARTLAKIQVLGSNYLNSLVEIIDPSNLPSFLGGNCTCSEIGGCLLNDKGPWNDPEIKELLQAISETEPKVSSEANGSMASEDASVPNVGYVQITSSYETRAGERESLEKHGYTKYVDKLIAQKIQSLEDGIKDTKMILEGFLMKHEELTRQIQELKELDFLRGLSDKKANT